ncbi:MAG: polynucleotide adenylyltransferase, partial [Clostridia bacterium]|nr:polynucleotide adenylyltransferase [Clostridia bacterium]
MSSIIILPKNVSFIISRLEENGFCAYAVGGCIRDILLSKKPMDWDICTNALPENIISVFSDYKIVTNGIKHGTVTVIIDKITYEVTTFRIDGNYLDNRHPDSVVFVDNLKEDLKRRDFTVNAMAYNNKIGIFDCFGGKEDLNDKIIRCVG